MGRLERLKFAQKWVGTATTDVFETVPERKFRYVLKVVATGDQVSTRVLDIYKKEEDGTYTPFLVNVNIAAPELKEIPAGPPDFDRPLLALEGGTSLAGKVSGNSISLTVIYYDSEV